MAGQILTPPSTALVPLGARQVQAIRNLTDNTWFGPLQPLLPTAPPGTQPRQFEYLPGQNLIWQPRAQEALTFSDMIYMADNCDLVRIVIEALKDQITMMPWQIRVRELPGETQKERGERQKSNPKVQQWTNFLEWPSPDQDWGAFLRMVLEDLFVLDAPSILLQRTRGGKIGALRPIDGQTITRLIDTNGFTPLPPDPAYQQILFGQPACDLTTDELVYRPRNQRTRKLYGFGPVEQIMLTLNIALRRMRFQLNYYTEGNVPEALYTMPANVTEDNVRKFQSWFDQQLAGNLASRRRVWFIPGDDKGVNRLHWTKEALLKDESDEWFARIICYAFRMSPKEFIRIMNRATAEESQDSAEEMGVRSVCQWIVTTINYIIQRKAGDTDIEFAFAQKREADILKQAQADEIYVKEGIRTRNQVRDNLGDDPSPDPMANVLGITTGTGFVPLDQIETANALAQQGLANKQQQGKPGEQRPENQPGTNRPSEDQNTQEPKANEGQKLLRFAKRLPLRIETGDSSISKTDIAQMESAVAGFLKTAGDRLADKVAALATQKARKAKDPRQQSFDDIMGAIEEIDWTELVAPVESSLFHAAATGATIGIGQVGISNVALISAASDTARDFAHQRAAELVGKRFTSKGKLVQNPSAKWRIDETTRKELRALVEKAFNEETPIAKLADQIRSAGSFSESRAKTVARTEIARAQSMGTLDVWKNMGFVKTVRWDLSADHEDQDLCDLNHDHGPVPLGQAFPSGDIAPPQHPNCRCSLVAAEISE